MDLSNINKRIFNYLKNSGKPEKLRTIVDDLHLDKRDVRDAVNSLVRSGQIFKLKSGKYGIVMEMGLLTGKIDAHPDGYAFFIPEGGGDDLFIPAARMAGAMHGDKVSVKQERYRGKPEAHVVKIHERGYSIVVGRVEKVSGHSHAYVIPFVRKLFFDIYISPEDAQGYKTDEVVICKIIKFPSGNRNPEGIIIKKLGNMDDKGIENEIVKAKYNIREKYPDHALKDLPNVMALAEKPGDREDFTDLFTVTIDGETARDFDDAISISKDSKGYTLYVHIADVSHFVRPETSIDLEAYKRATSVYFPEYAIHMLPEELSADLCSLKPDVPRFAVTAKMRFDLKGSRINTEIFTSLIKSDRRLTYTFVQDFLDGKIYGEDQRLEKLLLLSSELSIIIMGKKKKRGMVDFDFPESDLILDSDGEITEVKVAERYMSHRLIEHFMIEANEAVSEFLEEHSRFSVYRIHDKPDAKKISQFIDLCRTFGINVYEPEVLDSVTVSWLSDVIHNSKFSHVLGKYLVRTMAKAVYDVNNIGHFGLSSQSYTHFTSPIRRYPDLMVHRLIKEVLYKQRYGVDRKLLQEKCVHCSEKEQDADQAERDVEIFKKLKYLRKHMDEPFGAFINRATQNGLGIYIESLMTNGFVKISSLDDDYYTFDRESGTLKGRNKNNRFRVGDSLEVMLEKVNFDTLEAEFRIEKKVN